MTLKSRKLAVAAALVAAVSPPALAGTVSVGGITYSCTNHIQIGPDMSGLLKSFEIGEEYTFAFEQCVKACNATAGCIAVNVKELGPYGPTMCQLFSKVAGVTPYPIQTTSYGPSWGTACVNIGKTKWTPKNPNETYKANPHGPYVPPDTRSYRDDANRPGAPGAPSTHRQRP